MVWKVRKWSYFERGPCNLLRCKLLILSLGTVEVPKLWDCAWVGNPEEVKSNESEAKHLEVSLSKSFYFGELMVLKWICEGLNVSTEEGMPGAHHGGPWNATPKRPGAPVAEVPGLCGCETPK